MSNGNGRDSGSTMEKLASVASAAAGLAMLGWGLCELLTGSKEEEKVGYGKPMKAPGQPGVIIDRNEFTQNPQRYFQDLRKK